MCFIIVDEKKLSSEGSNRDDDDKLISEVDAEMARGVPNDLNLTRPTFLSVLEEKEEVEALTGRVEEMEKQNQECMRMLTNAEVDLEKVFIKVIMLSNWSTRPTHKHGR